MLKDPYFYFTILGIILSVIGVYLTLRYKYPGKITYIKEGALSLFNDVVKTMPELAVSYEGQPVQANLIIMRGHIINTGKKDITNDMISQPLTFSLPHGFKWKKVNITAQSNGLDAKYEVKNDASLLFNLGLFRCNEYISFEALAEIPNEINTKESAALRLKKAITISHRIADTRKVEERILPNDPFEAKSWIRTDTFLFLVLLFIFVILFPILEMIGEKPAIIQYTITREGKTFLAEVIPKANGELKIKGINHNIKYYQNSEEFFQDRSWSAKSVVKKKDMTAYILVALMLTGTGFFAAHELIERRRAKKLYKLLKKFELNFKTKHTH
ncbi:MAG: hypothetical protein Q6358_00330 [Candidatus Brocadiales bacterium]|nr:hypothetical protein [Candidatus Brocadiales bacterium]